MNRNDKKPYVLNFGPQHPAAHGVLRLLIEMQGERVVDIDTHIGLLHRGTEKLIEHRTYQQSIGYMDRLDYVSMLCNEHAYVLCLEKALHIDPPKRAQYIRVLFDEITRLLNHLLWLGAHGLDVGAMSIFLYCFHARETLMDCYEAVSGSRMHATYYRPGGVHRDLPQKMPLYKKSPGQSDQDLQRLNQDRGGSMIDFLESFLERFPQTLSLCENLLHENRIWKQRLENIGILNLEDALSYGCSGPILRASGYQWDLRKNQPYSVYPELDFDVPVRTQGDCYARYEVRIQEMKESMRLISQCLEWLKKNPGSIMIDNYKLTPPPYEKAQVHMEEMIHHFKFYSEGYSVPPCELYTAIEHPKGEFGVYLCSDGANKPYRLKIRAAGYPHLAILSKLAKGHLLADVVTLIGSLDIVFGEIDR